MLIQTSTKSKSRTPLLIILGILIVVTGGIVYWTYFSSAGVSVTSSVQTPQATFSTTFDTSVLQDVRVRGLKQHGPGDVQVSDRGRRSDPFVAF